jgi:hypothetical protein
MSIDIPPTPLDDENTSIVERPDGFYWQRKFDGREAGPFATLTEALTDMEYAEADIGGEETLAEAEGEIGIADWIDPETGQPAEDSVPHLEDH